MQLHGLHNNVIEETSADKQNKEKRSARALFFLRRTVSYYKHSAAERQTKIPVTNTVLPNYTEHFLSTYNVKNPINDTGL